MPSALNEKVPAITVEEFTEKCPAELGIEVIAGRSGLSKRSIDSARIQKLGLALAGFAHYIHSGRIQIVGQSEIWYLAQIDSQRRVEALENLSLDKISCILITKNLEPPPELIEVAEQRQLPLLRTTLVSSTAIGRVSDFLFELLAPQVTVHGVMLGMFGLGVLMIGNSGIGKSECALDLITRGHRLIADDAVVIKKIGERLEGSSPELIHGFLEIHGLGILNVRELFGVSVVGKSKTVELCIEFRKWDEFGEIDRLGLETQIEEILGVGLPKFVLPVSPGRNLSSLVETAVRIHLLRASGVDSTQKLLELHGAMVSGN